MKNCFKSKFGSMLLLLYVFGMNFFLTNSVLAFGNNVHNTTTVASLNCDVQADFKYEIYENTVVLYAWSNDRLNIDQYLWEFSDRSKAAGKEIKKEFRNLTDVKICLTVIRPTSNNEDSRSCSEQVCKTINVRDTEDPCNIKIDFRHEVNGGIVVFKAWSDNQSRTDRYVWEFEDGTKIAGPDAKKEFNRNGEYKVCLTLYKSLNNTDTRSCSEKICKVIKISDAENPCGIRADFDFRVNGGIVTFHAKSNEPNNNDRYIWDFDDNTRTDGKETKKQYQKNGSYEVCLTVVRPNRNIGSNTSISRTCTYKVCKKIRITDADNYCGLEADFRMDVSGNVVYAIAKSSAGDRAKYSWKISDGTSHSGKEIKHQLRRDGTYELCLTVTTEGNSNTARPCSTTICKRFVIGEPVLTNDCEIRVDFDFQQSGNTFAFFGKSNADEAEYHWTIEGATESSYIGQSFRTAFRVPGVYKVCLTVSSRELGCREQVCKRIVVGRNSEIISPNPVTNQFRIVADQDITSYKIIDAAQGVVKEGSIFGQDATVDLSELRSGVYFVHISYDDGTTSIQRVVKQ